MDCPPSSQESEIQALKPGEGEVAPAEVFRFMATYYIYQDQIGWSRTQTMVVVEVAVLAGAFARQGPLSPIVLVVGACVVCYLFRLIQRDWQVRDRIGCNLDPVLKRYDIRLVPAPAARLLRGGTIITRIAAGSIIVNLLLAAMKAWQLTAWRWPAGLDSLLK